MGSSALAVTRHESELGTWELIHREPAGILRAFVRRIEGYTSDVPPWSHRQLPSGRLPLIINIGAPLLGAPAHRQGELRPYQAFVAGLHNSYATTRYEKCMAGIQVDFSPLGMHTLLGGQPMDELANEMLDLDTVFGAEGRAIVEELQEISGWDRRFECIEAFLARRLASAPTPAEDIAFGWQRLESTAGCITIRSLADEMGYSRKQLISRFKTHVGFAPKTAARILRFQHAVEMVADADEVNWSDVAFDAGYYDQAHLIRDFVEFSGSTPTDYVARLLPDSGGVRGD